LYEHIYLTLETIIDNGKDKVCNKVNPHQHKQYKEQGIPTRRPLKQKIKIMSVDDISN